MAKTREDRREYWRQLIVEQQRSGLSVSALCRRHGISEQSFYQWRKRLAAQLPVKFALVQASAPQHIGGEVMEILLTSGERLRITQGVDAAMLRLVLSVMREPR